MKNRLLFVAAILMMALRLSAQDFEIVGVESLPADMSPREEMKADHAERQCALLRIATQNIVPSQRELFTFKPDLGSEVVERATRNGEIWLWVSPGLKYLRVMHRDLGQYEIRLLDHVPGIESLHTYRIVIRGTAPVSGPGNGGDVVARQQYLVFRMTPPNAMLEVNGKLWEVNADGVAKQLVDFGTYSYRVQSPNYHSETSTVTVDDPDNAKAVVVNLKPDFVEVTLQVDADAEIWVNNEMKGTRTWKGRLGKGKYRIECKQANHETSMVSKEITDEMNGQTIVLNAPRPIYGALNVDATPDFCDIYIDGKKVGQTPKFISQLLVGNHELKLTKAGYADYSETVTIAKGETKTVNATLSSTATVRFTCNAAGATLYVDGTALGSASGSYALGYGSHSLRATAEGYDDYTDNFTVSPGNTACTISMKAKFDNRTLTFTVNGVTFKMLPVEGGTFTMGATAEQGGNAESDGQPTHSVTLSSFYMGETEVTQALWQAVMGSNPSNFKGNNLPVETVSWKDCQTFINKLNQLLAGQLGGKRFALPTEAEWEYAARGGKKSRGYKYSGSNTLDNVAWYTSTTNDSGTKPVGTKTPNELGLYDMSGNVWEWCSDWYGSYGSGAQTNPTGSTSGSYRVGRGGSWINSAGLCRVSVRYYDSPDGRGRILGLRLSFR